MRILVTGGAGYIGSHTCIALADAGYEPVIYDNFSNASEKILPRINELVGQEVRCTKGDVLNQKQLTQALDQNQCEAVIHFAGLKSVAESHADPLKYFAVNVNGTISLLDAMKKCGLKTFIFSSSATVYGSPVELPYCEDHPLNPISPYGQSKLMVERILENLYASDQSWAISNLRYFNPVGAHASGKIGEAPLGIPNNLMPYLSQVAIGRREKLFIFGNDYDTNDGTGVRDYIHVTDLAKGHVAALKNLPTAHFTTLNLGTGSGISVLEMLKAFEKICGKKINYEYAERREGDIAAFFANSSKAQELLKWSATLTLDEMCRDTWNWQSNNPSGY